MVLGHVGGLFPRKGQGARPQGWDGSWARNAQESKHRESELGLPGSRGGRLSRTKDAPISFAFLP